MSENNPSPPLKPNDSGRWRRLGFTIFVLVVAWAFFAQLAPRLTMNEGSHGKSGSTADMKALTVRIAALEEEVKRLKEAPASIDIAALQKQIDALKQRRPGINRQVGELARKMASQQEALVNLQANLSAMQADTGLHMAGLTAFNQLREAVRRGEPFAYELKQLKTLTEGREDIQKQLTLFSPYADTGIPTLDALQQAFEETLPVALSPEVKPNSVMGQLKSLVQVRKVGNPQGNDNEAVIARAETALKEGRVKTSVEELKLLSKRSAAAFADWKEKASRHIEGNAALDALEIIFMTEPKREAPKAEEPSPTLTPEEQQLPAPETIEPAIPAEQ